MRRRTFLASVPLAAAAAGAAAQPTTEGPGQGGAPRSEEPGRAPFQPPGAERFQRDDVHAGDRPAGASFASRSAALIFMW